MPMARMSALPEMPSSRSAPTSAGGAVAVPAEPALDPLSLHGPEPGDQVLDVAGEQVAVVRQPVGERRPVVEHELAVLRALPDRGPEGVMDPPVLQHVPLE